MNFVREQRCFLMVSCARTAAQASTLLLAHCTILGVSYYDGMTG